ncbi:MAG TPA: polysaccharide deacetylase family protein [Armatimonadota bacterium]|jgi:peptidoglycan/xylan/chitin deacetylase (PgdA/CDA1 family)
MAEIWLGFDTESDVTQWSYEPGLPISGHVLDESLAAVARLTEILREHQTAATFFLVGRLLEVAGSEYYDLLGEQGHDVQCHTYSHHLIHERDMADSVEVAAGSVRRGLDLIEEWFGVRPVGLCAPGGSPTGFRGQPERLKLVWDEGIRFLKSDNLGSPASPMLPSRIEPYTYADDGYPDLWELPGVGWHCTMTLPRAPGEWPPRQIVPDGPLCPMPPRTPEEHIAHVTAELDYVREHDHQFSPSWHPWSLYRFDPGLTIVDFLLTYARDHQMPVYTYQRKYEEVVAAARSSERGASHDR